MIAVVDNSFHNYGTFAKRVIDYRRIQAFDDNWDMLAEVAAIADGIRAIVELPDVPEMHEALRKGNYPYVSIEKTFTKRANGNIRSINVELRPCNAEFFSSADIAEYDNLGEIHAIAMLNAIGEHVMNRTRYSEALEELPTKVDEEGHELSPLGKAMDSLQGYLVMTGGDLPLSRMKHMDGLRELIEACGPLIFEGGR